MTASSPTFDVERFAIWDDASNLHYEADNDLMVTCNKALGGGTLAGLVLLELGIDGVRTHRALVDARGFVEDPEEFSYGHDRLAVLNDAIEALTAMRDKLAALQGA